MIFVNERRAQERFRDLCSLKIKLTDHKSVRHAFGRHWRYIENMGFKSSLGTPLTNNHLFFGTVMLKSGSRQSRMHGHLEVSCLYLEISS